MAVIGDRSVVAAGGIGAAAVSRCINRITMLIMPMTGIKIGWCSIAAKARIGQAGSEQQGRKRCQQRDF